MESYVIIYLLKSGLPWQNTKAANRHQKLDKIAERKNTIKMEEFLHGYPIEFSTYIHYTKQLRFNEQPDYMYLRNLFRGLFQVWNLRWDFKFDWVIKS
jgi:hypothetical protein